jgi:hypothetical protein
MAGQRRNNGQNTEQLRDVGTREAGALCRPGRTEEEGEGVEWSGGVSDPALPLFGPLRTGSLTPTCLVSVVLLVAARMCAEIVAGFVPSSAPEITSRTRRPTS